jgi:hypothetical protein
MQQKRNSSHTGIFLPWKCCLKVLTVVSFCEQWLSHVTIYMFRTKQIQTSSLRRRNYNHEHDSSCRGSSTLTQWNNCCTCIDIFSSFRNLTKLASQSYCNDNVIYCGSFTLFY